MEKHLAVDCIRVPEAIKKLWEDILAERENNYNRGGSGSKKQKLESNQSIITNHLPSIDPLPLSISRNIDRALLKAWISCGIPFDIIENPFMLDFLKQMNSAYIPPTRNTLSGTLMDTEEAHVNQKMRKELQDAENLTLCKLI